MKRFLSALVLSVLALTVLCVPASAKVSDGGSAASQRVLSNGRGRTQMLLKLGELKTAPSHRRLGTALSAASKQALAGLPGVRVLEENEDAEAAAARRRPPVVMITGELTEIRQKPVGRDVIVSAKVEYFVHRMPGGSIAAVVSGSARATVDKLQVRNRPAREKLETDLVTAAAASAARRTEPALKAAVE